MSLQVILMLSYSVGRMVRKPFWRAIGHNLHQELKTVIPCPLVYSKEINQSANDICTRIFIVIDIVVKKGHKHYKMLNDMGMLRYMHVTGYIIFNIILKMTF